MKPWRNVVAERVMRIFGLSWRETSRLCLYQMSILLYSRCRFSETRIFANKSTFLSKYLFLVL
jgi:hypothetical protein